MEGGNFSLKVRIPPNTTAIVFVPAASAANVTASGAKLLREQDGAAVFEIESGEYLFVSRGFRGQ